MKYLLWISYDGKNYYGWTPQPKVPTIFKEINKASNSIFKKEMQIRCSGRTDRYVHALSLPVTIYGNSSINKDNVLSLMNKELPSDIRVKKIEVVPNDFEVRFGTKYKIYRYLTNLKGEGDVDYFNNHTYPFDLNKLIKASKLFIGEKDFASFTSKSNYENTVRNIFNIDIKLTDGILTMEIKGDGFMRYMVRNIVGALLAHNRGAISNSELNDLFKNPKIGKSHFKARGSGLYLVNVAY